MGGGSSICPDGSHISCFGALMLAPPPADNNNKKIDSVGTQSQALKWAKAFHKRDNVRRSYATPPVARSQRGAAVRLCLGRVTSETQRKAWH